MARSARRQTVRATCSAAPACDPPARMKRRSGGSAASSASIHPSSRVMSAGGDRRLRHPIRDLVSGIRQPRAEREQIPLDLLEHRGQLRDPRRRRSVARANPRYALSSSTSP